VNVVNQEGGSGTFQIWSTFVSDDERLSGVKCFDDLLGHAVREVTPDDSKANRLRRAHG
jgi:hypothetical protein